MNILHRLKKIEARTDKNHLEFCECFKKYINSEIDRMYEKEIGENTNSENRPLPDFDQSACEICGKPFFLQDTGFVKRLISIYGENE